MDTPEAIAPAALNSPSVRRAAAASVAGSQALEGVRVSPAAAVDIEDYVRGDCEADDLLRRALARHSTTPAASRLTLPGPVPH